MERTYQIILFLLIMFIIIYSFLPRFPYIHKSKIDGYGLFSGKSYSRGEIIIDNLFPNKERDEIIYNPIKTENFRKYILNEGLYINHCLSNHNVTIASKDYKTFPLIATKDIKKHEELTSNYNEVHKKFPIIAGSRPEYVNC